MNAKAREEWRSVVGWEGLYEISSHGRVRSVARHVPFAHNSGTKTTRAIRARILRQSPTCGYGYMAVSLAKHRTKTTTNIHRMVCEAFHGPCPDGYLARHLDGDPLNNNAENLAWGTYVDNEADKRAHGRTAEGERSGTCAISDDTVRRIRERRAAGMTGAAIARMFKTSNAHVNKITRGLARVSAGGPVTPGPMVETRRRYSAGPTSGVWETRVEAK